MKLVGVTQRVDVVASYGERRDALDQAWTPLLQRAGYQAIPLPNHCENVLELLSRLDLAGIVLSGGNDLSHLPEGNNVAKERDQFEKALIAAAIKQNVGMVGVCRGMQMLVTYFGGSLVRVEGHVASRHPLRLSNVESQRWPLSGRQEVNSYHQWGVQRAGLPDCLEVLATAPDSSVEACAHRNHKILGIMWHPERAPASDIDLPLFAACFA